MNVSRLLSNKNWQLKINPLIADQFSEDTNNFFLNPKNQRKWANNGMFLCKLSFIFLVIDALIYTLLFLLSRQLDIAAITEIVSAVIKVNYLFTY